MTDQLPHRRHIRHQTYSRLRRTDTGRFNKFLSEQATRLGAARRAIRDLFTRLGSKSAADIANASTAASLGASRITGTTALRFSDVRRADPGEVTVGAIMSGIALTFAPRAVSGVSLILSGGIITRATGAWDSNLLIADNARVRLVVSGAVSGTWLVSGLPSTSGLALIDADLGGPVTIHASSGYVDVCNALSGDATLLPAEIGMRFRALSGISLNTDSFIVNDYQSPEIVHAELDREFDYEVAASGQLFATNLLYTENEEMADEEVVSGTMGVQAGAKFLKLVTTSGGINALSGGWIHANFANGPSGYYILSGDCFSGHEVLASGQAEVLFSCMVSGAADWATSGFAVGDAFLVSGVSAAIDAGGPYFVRKIAPSGILIDPGAFAADTDVSDSAHVVFEIASGSR